MLGSDKELDAELKGRPLAQLRRIRGRYVVVPTSCALVGVVRDDPLRRRPVLSRKPGRELIGKNQWQLRSSR